MFLKGKREMQAFCLSTEKIFYIMGYCEQIKGFKNWDCAVVQTMMLWMIT